MCLWCRRVMTALTLLLLRWTDVSLSAPQGGLCLTRPGRCPWDAALPDGLGCTWGQRPGAERTYCSGRSIQDWRERGSGFAHDEFTEREFMLNHTAAFWMLHCKGCRTVYYSPNSNLQQCLDCAKRVSESTAKLLQSLISNVVVWEIHLADDALVRCQCFCQLSTALVSEAAPTQAEMGGNENSFFLFLHTCWQLYDTERHLGSGLLDFFEMAVGIALQAGWNMIGSLVSKAVQADVEIY